MKHTFSPHSRHRRAHAQSVRALAPKSHTNDIDPAKFINKAIAINEEMYRPRHTFRDFNLSPRLLGNVEAKGYQQPTPIQDQAIKPILAGQDLIGLANTGTGKTAAFLLPIINHYLQGYRDGTLIICPTRELATQIYDEFLGFAKGLNLRAAVCVGGMNINRQINDLKRGPHLVIGTPGRLKDLLNQEALYLGNCTTLVLDEADRMLDMGFIRDIRAIIGCLPAQKQTMLFSATMTRGIEDLARTLLHNPTTVSVRTRETSDHVNQDIIKIASPDQKLAQLEELLNQPDYTKVLVFGATKWGVQKLAIKLAQKGFKVEAIHGNKTQPQRQRALKAFKEEKIQALIATDVAARGLDIPNVSHVINYDLPNTYEEYVHRIGRTGRANQTGQAITFVPAEAVAV